MPYTSYTGSWPNAVDRHAKLNIERGSNCIPDGSTDPDPTDPPAKPCGGGGKAGIPGACKEPDAGLDEGEAGTACQRQTVVAWDVRRQGKEETIGTADIIIFRYFSTLTQFPRSMATSKGKIECEGPQAAAAYDSYRIVTANETL